MRGGGGRLRQTDRQTKSKAVIELGGSGQSVCKRIFLKILMYFKATVPGTEHMPQ